MRNHLSKLIKTLKKALSYSLYYTGILGYIVKKKLSSKTLILTYHRVLPFAKRHLSFSHEAIMVDPTNFDMQLEVINKYFSVIDLNTLIHGDKEKKAESAPRCLITFDDGWYDNYDYAYPILKKHDCKAVIFVPLDFVSSENTFWQEKLGYLIWKTAETNTKQSNELLQKLDVFEFNLKNNNDKQLGIMNYVRSLKSMTYDEIEQIMTEFSCYKDSDAGSPIDKHMTWDHLLELHNNGIEIGSHACSHKILTKLTSEEVNEELNRSKSILEEKLQSKVNSIAYPNGDYNIEIGGFAEGAGYKCGFGTTYGYVDKESNIYNLERVNINDTVADSKPLFLATLLGIF
jgi:peptidoglycan/xylan/chitin deacetylase (PgdA/CDA1 family)